MWIAIGFQFIFISIGAAAIYGGYRCIQQKRIIENLPTSTVRGLATGLVELSGKAMPTKQILKSPFSKTPCVYYNTIVEKYQGSGNTPPWAVVYREKSKEPIIVDDGTGKVVVDQKKAIMDISQPLKIKERTKEFKNKVEKFLNERGAKKEWIGYRINAELHAGLKLSILQKANTYRITEHTIKKGDKVYVLGTAVSDPKVLRAVQGCEKLIITKKGSYFHISTKPEHDVKNTFAIRATFLFLLGGVLLYFGIWFTLAILGYVT